MTKLTDPVRSINLVVCLYPKSMESYSELPDKDTKSMHPVTKRVPGLDNEPVFYFQEVLSIKGHLWAQPSWRIDPGNLDKLPVNTLPDDLV